MLRPILIQVQHDKIKSDKSLFYWLEKIKILSELPSGCLRWSIDNFDFDGPCIEVVITFNADKSVSLEIKNSFLRKIYFSCTSDDNQKMQYVLDIFINSWAKLGLIGIDFSDVIAVLEHSNYGIITNINNVKALPKFCVERKNNSNILIENSITSLLCIYREYAPELINFGIYAESVDSLVDENGVVVVGVIPVENELSPQNAVIYFGCS